MTDIVEDLAGWTTTFQAGWLAHYVATGQTDFKQYVRPHNHTAPAGPAVDLAQSRLILISSAGGYLSATQARFDAENPLGDYTLRTFPRATTFDALVYAQTHYDHAAVDADPQVLLPLRHLEQLQALGEIGELAEQVISFSGYQPDVARVVAEVAPAVVDLVLKEQAHAALLVPS